MGIDVLRKEIDDIDSKIVELFNERMKLAAELVLPHRMRRKPFEEQHMDIAAVFEMIESREQI